uniref:Uncharacterized protein n=2 Tax=Aegilops tauschii subsp. strangulata TaxID=200361 RepID=A0A453PVD5_AEGTS
MAVHPINCSKHDLKGLFILSVVQNHDRVHAAEKAAQLLEDKNRQQEAAQMKANRAAKRARRDNRKNAQGKKESAPVDSLNLPSRSWFIASLPLQTIRVLSDIHSSLTFTELSKLFL